MTQMKDEIRFLGDMTKLDLNPGDMLVLQLDRVLSDEQFQQVTDRMVDIFGKGRVVILDAGMKLGALSMPQYIHVDEHGNVTPVPASMQRNA